MPLDRELNIGDSGEAVKALQAAIARLLDTAALKQLRDDAAWLAAWNEDKRGAKYGKATETAIKAIQQSARLESSGALNANTIKDINELIAGLDQTQPSTPSIPSEQAAGRIDGRILDASGSGMAGLDVSVAIVFVAGADQRIGSAKSDDDGNYVVPYQLTPAQVTAQIVGHLRVTAMRDGKPVARSEVLFNAPPVVQGFDITADAKAVPVASDFAQVLGAARRAAEKSGIRLEALEETDDKPSASLLAAETRHDAVKIALVSGALAIEEQSHGAITAELAYGLASQGVPLALVDIAGLHSDVLMEHVERAVQRGIVSVKARDAIKPALQASGAARSQAAIVQVRASPAGEQLARAAGAQADKFFAMAAAHTGSAEDFWNQVGKDPALKPVQPALRFVAATTVLAGDHAATHALLQKARDAHDIAMAEDLAGWTAADWLQRLQAVQAVAPGVDASASAADKASALDRYARRLDLLVEASWPAAYARNRIAASTLGTKANVLAFLGRAPDFDPRHQRLSAYLARQPQQAAGLAPDTQAAIEALGRTMRVASRIDPALALMADGLHSARSVAAQGPTRFARRYAGHFGGEGPAREAHGRARLITALSNEMYVQAAPHGGHTNVPVMAPAGVTTMPASPDWASLFGHADNCACEQCQALTGPAAYLVDTLHFLKKRDSRLAGPGGSKKPALDVLRKPGRRPDLCEIALSCENTETVLPYIDLVNEILEDAVAPLPAFAPADFTGPVAPAAGTDSLPDALRTAINQALGLTTAANADFAISPQARLHSLTDGQPWNSAIPAWHIEDDLSTYAISPKAGNTFTVTARSRQTRGPSLERLVARQYINKAAYKRLAGAVYPWTLPYDRPRAEARAILGKLDTTLAKVMTAFAPGSEAQVRDSEPIAIERLGLSPADADIVAPSAALAQPWRYWGFSNANVSPANPIPDPTDVTKSITTASAWTDMLASRLDVLLERGRLSYADLLALLDTLYVNPVNGNARRIAITSTDAAAPDSCDTSRLHLQGCDADAPQRIMRMARLAQRSGLSFAEIDKALRAFGAADIDRAFLVKLAQAVQLNARYDGDLERVLADLIPP